MSETEGLGRGVSIGYEESIDYLAWLEEAPRRLGLDPARSPRTARGIETIVTMYAD